MISVRSLTIIYRALQAYQERMDITNVEQADIDFAKRELQHLAEMRPTPVVTPRVHRSTCKLCGEGHGVKGMVWPFYEPAYPTGPYHHECHVQAKEAHRVRDQASMAVRPICRECVRPVCLVCKQASTGTRPNPGETNPGYVWYHDAEDGPEGYYHDDCHERARGLRPYTLADVVLQRLPNRDREIWTASIYLLRDRTTGRPLWRARGRSPNDAIRGLARILTEHDQPFDFSEGRA